MQLYLIKFLAFYLGCLSCVSFQSTFGLSPVLSSALVGFLGTFLRAPYVEKKGLHAMIYAGSFAGMCSAELLSSHPSIILISLVGTLIYLMSRPHLNGFGGRLGTIAFISSVFLMFTRKLW